MAVVEEVEARAEIRPRRRAIRDTRTQELLWLCNAQARRGWAKRHTCPGRNVLDGAHTVAEVTHLRGGAQVRRPQTGNKRRNTHCSHRTRRLCWQQRKQTANSTIYVVL
eukprot:673670-Rhodomonas_salina.1